MGLDATLKRFFPLVLCALIALVAYFQASGCGELVGVTVSEAPQSGPPRTAAPKGEKRRTITGDPILARNPFDSVTGPLLGDRSGIPTPVPGDGEGTDLAAGDPLGDPSCDFGRVVLITESDDPEWSFAAIEDNKSGESKLRRRGDEIGGHTVQFVRWDRVWLKSGSARCQLKLGDKSMSKARQSKSTSSKRKPRKKRKSRQLPAEMAAKINKVSDTEFNVERSVVDEILENQAELMRTARIVPEKDGDKVVGIRLFGIRRGTLLNHLGFKNGDRLQSINGFEISDPQKALEAYGRLRTAQDLKVVINRKGSPMTLDFNIQ